MVKMIVLDLDGTVLRSDESVSGRSLEVLEECRARGILVCVATARSKAGARVFTELMVPDVLIYDGGTVAVVGDEVVYDVRMDVDFANQLIGELGCVEFSAQGGEGYFCNRKELARCGQRKAAVGERVEKFDRAVGVDVPIYKIVAALDAPKVKLLSEKYPNLEFEPFDDNSFVRTQLKGAGKWASIVAAAARLGVCTAEIAAFGDDWNDTQMLEKCGIGVAMGNAIPEVRAIADFVTADNDADGVAVWLENNVIGG